VGFGLELNEQPIVTEQEDQAIKNFAYNSHLLLILLFLSFIESSKFAPAGDFNSMPLHSKPKESHWPVASLWPPWPLPPNRLERRRYLGERFQGQNCAHCIETLCSVPPRQGCDVDQLDRVKHTHLTTLKQEKPSTPRKPP
jgi:hypothetical protein